MKTSNFKKSRTSPLRQGRKVSVLYTGTPNQWTIKTGVGESYAVNRVIAAAMIKSINRAGVVGQCLFHHWLLANELEDC